MPEILYLSVSKAGAKLAQRLAALRAAGPHVLAAALYAEAEDLRRDIIEKPEVPRRFGHLADSGYVAEPHIVGNTVSVIFGFGGTAAPYAWAIHEHKRAGKTQGFAPSGRKYKDWARVGHWHYVSGPLAKYQKVMLSRVARRIEREWKGLL